MQQEIPPDKLSRVYSYDALGSIALVPVGYAIAGPIADAIGVRATLWGAAAIGIAVTLPVLAVPDVRRIERRAADRIIFGRHAAASRHPRGRGVPAGAAIPPSSRRSGRTARPTPSPPGTPGRTASSCSNMDESRARLGHMRHDPRVSLTVLDKDDWYRHVTLRGKVIRIEDDPDLAGIDRLSRCATGAGRTGTATASASAPGCSRALVRVVAV